MQVIIRRMKIESSSRFLMMLLLMSQQNVASAVIQVTPRSYAAPQMSRPYNLVNLLPSRPTLSSFKGGSNEMKIANIGCSLISSVDDEKNKYNGILSLTTSVAGLFGMRQQQQRSHIDYLLSVVMKLRGAGNHGVSFHWKNRFVRILIRCMVWTGKFMVCYSIIILICVLVRRSLEHRLPPPRGARAAGGSIRRKRRRKKRKHPFDDDDRDDDDDDDDDPPSDAGATGGALRRRRFRKDDDDDDGWLKRQRHDEVDGEESDNDFLFQRRETKYEN